MLAISQHVRLALSALQLVKRPGSGGVFMRQGSRRQRLQRCASLAAVLKQSCNLAKLFQDHSGTCTACVRPCKHAT